MFAKSSAARDDSRNGEQDGNDSQQYLPPRVVKWNGTELAREGGGVIDAVIHQRGEREEGHVASALAGPVAVAAFAAIGAPATAALQIAKYAANIVVFTNHEIPQSLPQEFQFPG